MTATPRPPADRPNHSSRWPGRTWPALLHWLGESAQRHTSPRRAVTALVAVTVITLVVLATLAGPPAPQQTVKIARSTTGDAAAAAADPIREAPRPMAAAPGRSPAPGSGAGDGVPDQPTGDFTGWAVLDRRTGAITGSETLADTSTTASMIKVWLVADYLRTYGTAERPRQTRMDELSRIVRDSENGLAQVLFEELGEHASITRLIQICGLTDSYPVPHLWSNTQLSARDTARMGACIADGRAAGPQWTDWLLGEMRAVRDPGDFGIRHALPPAQRSLVAIKNGWVIRTDENAWHVNCLAISGTWTMGILTRYPAELGYEHGAELCRSLAEQHLP